MFIQYVIAAALGLAPTTSSESVREPVGQKMADSLGTISDSSEVEQLRAETLKLIDRDAASVNGLRSEVLKLIDHDTDVNNEMKGFVKLLQNQENQIGRLLDCNDDLKKQIDQLVQKVSTLPPRTAQLRIPDDSKLDDAQQARFQQIAKDGSYSREQMIEVNEYMYKIGQIQKEEIRKLKEETAALKSALSYTSDMKSELIDKFRKIVEDLKAGTEQYVMEQGKYSDSLQEQIKELKKRVDALEHQQLLKQVNPKRR